MALQWHEMAGKNAHLFRNKKMAEKHTYKTKSHSSIVLCHAKKIISATSNKQRIIYFMSSWSPTGRALSHSLYLYGFLLYLKWIYCIIWHRIVFEIEKHFLCVVAVAVVWECVASTDMIIIDISNNKQQASDNRDGHISRTFFCSIRLWERDKLDGNSEKMGQHSKVLRKIFQQNMLQINLLTES